MRREEALDQLPAPYANALRMAEAGRADEEIAAVVGVDIEALGSFLQIGRAKLEAVMNSNGSSPGANGAPR